MTSTYSRQLNVSFNPETGASQIVNGKLITEYLDIAPYKGIATASQPVPHVCLLLTWSYCLLTHLLTLIDLLSSANA